MTTSSQWGYPPPRKPAPAPRRPPRRRRTPWPMRCRKRHPRRRLPRRPRRLPRPAPRLAAAPTAEGTPAAPAAEAPPAALHVSTDVLDDRDQSQRRRARSGRLEGYPLRKDAPQYSGQALELRSAADLVPVAERTHRRRRRGGADAFGALEIRSKEFRARAGRQRAARAVDVDGRCRAQRHQDIRFQARPVRHRT